MKTSVVSNGLGMLIFLGRRNTLFEAESGGCSFPGATNREVPP